MKTGAIMVTGTVTGAGAEHARRGGGAGRSGNGHRNNPGAPPVHHHRADTPPHTHGGRNTKGLGRYWTDDRMSRTPGYPLPGVIPGSGPSGPLPPPAPIGANQPSMWACPPCMDNWAYMLSALLQATNGASPAGAEPHPMLIRVADSRLPESQTRGFLDAGS